MDAGDRRRPGRGGAVIRLVHLRLVARDRAFVVISDVAGRFDRVGHPLRPLHHPDHRRELRPWRQHRWPASLALGGFQGADEDEIEFRDGIHGLLVWALAVALGALLAAAAAAALASTSAPAASVSNTTAGEPIIAYDLDRLFRSQQAPTPAADLSYSRAEAARIAMRAASRRDSSDLAEDRAHLLRIVSVRIGLTGANAEARVGDFIENEGHQEGSSERGRGGVHDCRGPCPRGGHRVVRVRRGWQPSRRDAFVPQLAAHPLATVGVIAV